MLFLLGIGNMRLIYIGNVSRLEIEANINNFFSTFSIHVLVDNLEKKKKLLKC